MKLKEIFDEEKKHRLLLLIDNNQKKFEYISNAITLLVSAIISFAIISIINIGENINKTPVYIAIFIFITTFFCIINVAIQTKIQKAIKIAEWIEISRRLG